MILFFLVRNLALKTRSILSPSRTSPIWKRKLEPTIGEQSDPSIITCTSPSPTICSDRDNMSLQSTSSSSSATQVTPSNSLEINHQPFITEQEYLLLQGQDRLVRIRTDEIYRRRCYRAGLNIFNKYVVSNRVNK